MARQFSMATVFRMVPTGLLKEFFDRRALGHLDIPWATLKKRDVGPLVEATRRLPPAQYDPLEAELHAVFDLACETGICALIEAATTCGIERPFAALPAEDTVYGKAMWAWLHWPEAMQTAFFIHQVELLNWWRKRNDLPVREPYLSRDAVSQLEQEVSRTLWEEQGRGSRCTVESFTRGDTFYLFAHPDDYVQNVTAHDAAGVLAPRTFRRTFLTVFAYNRAEGSLELCIKSPAPLKTRLEGAFARHILGHELGPWNAKPVYNLNHLAAPGFAFNTDPSDGVTARLKRMRLHLKNSERRITLEADLDRGPDDLRRMMAESLNEDNVPLSAVNVGMVTLCFEFAEVNGRKGGSMTFDVAFPSSCTLRNHRPACVEIVRKYLKLWGIDGSRPDPTALGAPRP